MSDGSAFLAQNSRFAADLTHDDRLTVGVHAEHHAGGLMVLGREVGDGRYVKAHDSWGGDDQVVVHTYDPDGPDNDPREHVAYFDSGHEALVAFLAVEPDGQTVRVLVAVDVPARFARDRLDLVGAVIARLDHEAGYLDDGTPVEPTAVTATVVEDDQPLTPDTLRGAYEVGAEGIGQ